MTFNYNTSSLLYNDIADDALIYELCKEELIRQQDSICLIASENIASRAVMQAYASAFTNKYAEGYPAKRFYEGCDVVDKLELECIKRACALFNVQYANVQPHSGSQANIAVLNAFLSPKDTILGMDLGSGGHLTHGFKANLSGKYYKAVQYFVDQETQLIDYDQLYQTALEECPKVIFAGASSYSRSIEWQKIRLIADEVGALLVADIAHLAGLIVTGVIDSPVDYAHIITTTTHKTLRGPRGGLILTNNEDYMKKINRSLMPGVQGGPLMHVIAAKAVAFKEAATKEFRQYALQILKNSKAMCEVFMQAGLEVIGNGTDNHLMVLNVSQLGISGKQAANLLADRKIVVNYNAIPFDTLPLTETSGIRIGTPFITSCGFDEQDSALLANVILALLCQKNVSEGILSALKNKIKHTYKQIFDTKVCV